MGSLRWLRPGASGLLAALAALLAAPPPAATAPVSIDFESLGLDELVTSQFAGDGIVFENAVTLVAGLSLNEIQFPPSSGANVITGFDNGPLGVGFTQAAQAVRFQLISGEVSVVRYFDELSALLAEIVVAPNLGQDTQVEYTAASPLIAAVSIGGQLTGNAFFLTVDDFEVGFDEPISAPIPEPSAFLGMTFGLVMVGVAVRRRR